MHDQPTTEDTASCIALIRALCGLYLYHPDQLGIDVQEKERGACFLFRCADDDMRKMLGGNRGDTFSALAHIVGQLGVARGVPQRARLLEPNPGNRRTSYPTFNAEEHDPQPTAELLKTLIEAMTDDEAQIVVVSLNAPGEATLSYLFQIYVRSEEARAKLTASWPDFRNGRTITTIEALEILLMAAGYTLGVTYKVADGALTPKP